MLRTTCPNISIVTNFGCESNCWYCIWKNHRLKHVQGPTDWDKLHQFIYKHKEKGKLSVSGGGDCLYKYDEHVGWWSKLFDITSDLGVLVDVHTREKFMHQHFWKRHINRCVFSSDLLNVDEDYLVYLSNFTKIRITHLVTKNTTFKMVDDYLAFQDRIGCQFTLKELVGHDDGGMYLKIKELYKGLYYLDKGDYNIYYMPDNSVTTIFL